MSIKIDMFIHYKIQPHFIFSKFMKLCYSIRLKLCHFASWIDNVSICINIKPMNWAHFSSVCANGGSLFLHKRMAGTFIECSAKAGMGATHIGVGVVLKLI